MMEKLFAVQHQRETFLWLCLGGAALGLVMDLTRIPKGRMGRAAGDVLAALMLFAMLACASLHAGEGLRLYALLGVSVGAALYLLVVSRAAHIAASAVKKLILRFSSGRKSG